MLVTPASTPPTGEGWIHETKLDGWRCLLHVSGGQVQVGSLRGGDYTSTLPEPQVLSGLGDVVLDGELVVVTSEAEPISNSSRGESMPRGSRSISCWRTGWTQVEGCARPLAPVFRRGDVSVGDERAGRGDVGVAAGS
jgi:hypothetical protein